MSKFEASVIHAIGKALGLGGGKAEWKKIVESVSRDKIKIPAGNWLKVRGTLQWLINEGYISRTPSVFCEEYRVGKSINEILNYAADTLFNYEAKEGKFNQN